MKKDYAPVIKKIEEIAEKIYTDFQSQDIPFLKLPTRSKSNIKFDDRLNVWKYGSHRIQRSAKTLDGAYMLLRTMYMVDFIKEMIKIKKSSTLREMYYISEGWDLAKFHSQNESNLLAEDLEVITNLLREDFKLRPEEDGARVIGNITIEEITRNNRMQKIHCQDDVGDSGYSIPYNVEPEKISFKKVDVDFIIAIETGGMFDRLVENHFDEEYQALLVHLKGQPARSTRRFMQRINSEHNVPVVVFTDCDPWSFRIFASVAYGAIKTAHISEYLATPSSSFLGVSPSDIENYDLPTDDLTKEDIKSLKSELSDPRFNDSFWKHEIKLQLKLGKKSEQQALAKYGLDYVTDTYLPEKLGQLGMISK
ncbi:MAG: DNA topoisomerase IV subunit A [Candidatus Thermoplasmatota archaeon]|nr:DNA topoisomerase IV subunit A [Candidatus Thermoplasmatota archaeon]